MKFALIHSTTGEVGYAFKSSALTKYVKDNGDKFISAWLSVQDQALNPRSKGQLELHLITKNRDEVILSEHDQLKIATNYTPTEKSTRLSMYAPHQIWDIPRKVPYSLMLMTHRLVDRIDEIGKKHQMLQVVYMIWRDYRLEIDGELATGEKININGEFLKYTAKRFSNELVLFDL